MQDNVSVDVLRVTLTNATSGAYTVVQLNEIDHPTPGASEENILFNIGYRVTDHDGDTVDGSLTIDVDDDTPTVAANAIVYTDDETAVSPDAAPNLGGADDYNGTTPPANLTGTLAHSYGADGAGSTLLLGTGAPGGFTYVLSNGNTVLTIRQVQDGSPVDVLRVTLTNSTSGAYTVQQLNEIDHPTPGATEENILFNIGYRVTDHDGDTVDGTLTIDVDDDTPVTAAEANLVVTVDEDGLPGHAADGAPLRPGEETGSGLGHRGRCDRRAGGIGQLRCGWPAPDAGVLACEHAVAGADQPDVAGRRGADRLGRDDADRLCGARRWRRLRIRRGRSRGVHLHCRRKRFL